MSDVPAKVPDFWAGRGYEAVHDLEGIDCPGCHLLICAKKPVESAPWIDHQITAWRCSNCLELVFAVDGDPSASITDACNERSDIDFGRTPDWKSQEQQDDGGQP